MKIKSLVALAVLASSGASSFAITSATPLTFTGNTATFGSYVVGDFTNEWTFSLPTSSSVNAAVTNVALSFGPFSFGGITSFSAWLDGTQLASSSSSALAAPFTSNTTVLTGGLSSITGAHKLTVSGNAGVGAAYVGSVVTAPVPEPETYAMLLAGLGLMGAVARRRNKSKAA